jgi:hypothetical protein
MEGKRFVAFVKAVFFSHSLVESRLSTQSFASSGALDSGSQHLTMVSASSETRSLSCTFHPHVYLFSSTDLLRSFAQ